MVRHETVCPDLHPKMSAPFEEIPGTPYLLDALCFGPGFRR